MLIIYISILLICLSFSSCNTSLFVRDNYDVVTYDEFVKKLDDGDIIMRPFNDGSYDMDLRDAWGGWSFMRQDVGIVFKDSINNYNIWGIVDSYPSPKIKLGFKNRDLHSFLQFECLLRDNSPFILRKLIVADSSKRNLIDSLRLYLQDKMNSIVYFNGITNKSFSAVAWILQKNKLLCDTQNVNILWAAHYLEKDKMLEYDLNNNGRTYWKSVPKLKFSDPSISLSHEIHFKPFVRNDSVLFKVYRNPLRTE